MASALPLPYRRSVRRSGSMSYVLTSVYVGNSDMGAFVRFVHPG